MGLKAKDAILRLDGIPQRPGYSRVELVDGMVDDVSLENVTLFRFERLDHHTARFFCMTPHGDFYFNITSGEKRTASKVTTVLVSKPRGFIPTRKRGSSPTEVEDK